MGKIPEETIQQIAAANDIVDVIGGYFPLKRAGTAFRALCPFHREKTPSFNVNPQRQMYHCFGCGAGGSVFRFVMAYENVDFPTAARRLAERAGVRIVEEEFSPGEQRKADRRRRLLAMHQDAAKWFHNELLKGPGAGEARSYLKGRGITAEIARSWQLGFAPDSWDALSRKLRDAGYSDEELAESGLFALRESGGSYDRFRNRVIFPICNDLGEVIAFSGRTLEANPQTAKYINSPETILFTKGQVLFGLHKSKRPLIEAKSAIVCEGQLDLITAFESGVENVIAPQGTAFTARQAQILKRYVEEVVLCFDADAAGMKAAERSLPALLSSNLFVRVAQMPAGHDPDSLIRTAGPGAFREQIDQARDFFEYQIERFSASPEAGTTRGQSEFVRKAAGWVRLIGDPVAADSQLKKIVSRLGLSEPVFRAAIQKSPAPGDDRDDQTGSALPAVTGMKPTIRLLCVIALRDGLGRALLKQPDWRRFLEEEQGADLLLRILDSGIDPANAATFSAFTAQLAAAEESVVAALSLERLPPNIEAVLDDCRAGLERERIRRRQEEIASRLRFPGLPQSEVEQLQKEVLDLQKRLTDIARPFPRIS